jgi:hypothetical protein
MTGVIKPRMPIRRLTLVLGQQQIVLNTQKLRAFGDINMSDLPYTHQFRANQDAFAPLVIDLTRFGLRVDE